MSDLQNSFFFMDPKLEVVDAVSVSFFNGSDLYLALCWEVPVQYFCSLALLVVFGQSVYCSVGKSGLGVVLWVIAVLKTHSVTTGKSVFLISSFINNGIKNYPGKFING